MSVERIVMGIIERDMLNIAQRVEADFKAAVGKHNRTGQAQGSIRILEQNANRVLIGGYDEHLYWLDEGNARGGNPIVPKRAKALGKYPGGIPGIGWRASVSPYKGFHIAKQVADKYR